MPAKKDNPDYSQLAGHVPKGLARQFRVLCSTKDINVSQGLEEAIQSWVSENTQTPRSTQRDADKLTDFLQGIIDGKPMTAAAAITLAEDIGVDSDLLIQLLECCTGSRSNGTPA